MFGSIYFAQEYFAGMWQAATTVPASGGGGGPPAGRRLEPKHDRRGLENQIETFLVVFLNVEQ